MTAQQSDLALLREIADLKARLARLESAGAPYTTTAAGGMTTPELNVGSASGAAAGQMLYSVPAVCSYLYTEWNPSDLVATFTNAPGTGTEDKNSAFYTLANSSGTLTVTFAKAGQYLVSVSAKAVHAAAYTISNIAVTYGGTATRRVSRDFDNWGQDSQDGNDTATDTFLVVATASQTATFLPKFRVTGSGTTASHTAGCQITVLYCGG